MGDGTSQGGKDAPAAADRRIQAFSAPKTGRPACTCPERSAVEGVDTGAGLTGRAFDDQPEDDHEIAAGQLPLLDVARQPAGQRHLVAMAELGGLWLRIADCAHRHLSIPPPRAARCGRHS